MKYLEYNLIAMKKFIFLLFAAVLLASCHDEPAMRLNPEAMISIKPDPKGWNNTMSLKSAEHLSALEIVYQTTGMRFKNDGMFSSLGAFRGFADAQRDTSASNPCLKMWGTDIINGEGEYTPEFIEGYDVILEHWANSGSTLSKRDTIGYIPNAVLRAAEDSIRIALQNQDTAAVYRIFNDAFTFRPITGAEWLELKRQGLE